MSRTVQRKTNIIDTSTTLGQNAASITSKPVLNQNVNVNIIPTTAQETSQPTSQPTNESVNPYNTILQQNEETPTKESLSALASQQPQNELFVYQKLMNIYKNALLDDPQLTLNLIDQSGEIILRSDDLVDIIAHCCGVGKSDVKITYYIDDDKVGCCALCSKINPIKEIQSIKICSNGQYLDLVINFNGVYNKIKDEFKISLRRVLLSQPIAYV